MAAETQHFKVDNGDMTLMELQSGRTILVDINIRKAADDADDDDDTPDVANQLRDALDRDSDGRLYVDAFMLTHPDKDHCAGLETHFHLGKIEDWSPEDDKIVIREMWSTPFFFHPASKDNPRCPDAKAWAKEAKRRVGVFEDEDSVEEGDRILILSEDDDGNTDGLDDILVEAGDTFSAICGHSNEGFEAVLLAPLPVDEDDDEDELQSKNNTSAVTRFTLAQDDAEDAAQYLFCGDAEVAVLEKIWNEYGSTPEVLQYDVLISPHHCSWHSLSHDSWSEKGRDGEVSKDARSALSQANDGAIILASSKEIEDDDSDPPCVGAKEEYEDILSSNGTDGDFRCLAEENGDKPFKLEITEHGPKPAALAVAAVMSTSTAIGVEAQAHGCRNKDS